MGYMNDTTKQTETLYQIMVHASEVLPRDEWIRFTYDSIDCFSEEERKDLINHLNHSQYIEVTESLDTTYSNIIKWAKDRKIIPNGNCMTQAIKTLEEVHELIRAIDRDDKDEITDAYGDILVTIANGAYLHGTELPECAYKAYKVIEHRTGTLLSNGDFVKDK